MRTIIQKLGTLSATLALSACLSTAATTPAGTSAPISLADFIPENEFFVGVDDLQKIPSGTYSGLANPNHGRLTLLYGHQYDGSGETSISTSHYHAKSALVYKGEAGSPTTAPSPANYLPEGKIPPLSLLPGAGALSDFYVSGVERKPFANMTLRPVAWLNRNQPKEWETATFKSGSRWTGSLSKANVALEVVSLTDGMVILKADGSILADSSGDQVVLGTDDFAFTPVYAVKKTSTSGPYTAQLRLRDLTGNHGDSGVFEFRFHLGPKS